MKNEIQFYKNELFENIKNNDVDTLLGCIKSFKKEYKKGETIYLEEDKIYYLGIIISGSVHMLKSDIWGNSSLFTFFGPGELFGESFAVQKNISSSVIFKASQDTKVLFLAATNIIHTCPNACAFHAQISTNLFNLLGIKNQKFLDKIEILSKASIREKLLAYISQLSQEQNSRYVHSPLSRLSLADYLNVNRSAMSRELSKMRDEGIIDFDKDTFIIR
ncbi:cAMP-binding domain of CRP or a regulatory subunit of cAMP-dependent protein kinases [Acetitomaculum ruminis DSM 5522]|uniref:cAMP-binding domain of CRP or a regulatory subunit of cAMP-dependent protein kinases n=1 Tax=Acetitomaculum ruminis DSM 5522 TaxID=1120918 RepID=A0A1I1AFV6_9FIRM|nr:Crp/Fnr family transcriptional regulator [Acetitomaculum ruminis]SFB35213.1 cAMP-binding domain of CRP or a regulatory subunit of cAMP-dependent protein kinases [Acetitomaculum ruminis DSM 5522]